MRVFVLDHLFLRDTAACVPLARVPEYTYTKAGRISSSLLVISVAALLPLSSFTTRPFIHLASSFISFLSRIFQFPSISQASPTSFLISTSSSFSNSLLRFFGARSQGVSCSLHEEGVHAAGIRG